MSSTVRPDFAKTIDNQAAPNRLSGGVVHQPSVDGLKKFYKRKHSATKKTSLSNMGVNEQSYSPMTKFKHNLEGNKI